ncbi:RNA polymerase sigma factor [Christiangramia flava]|uniref:RNA polymerase ECF-type sigma factor n=1 Tax=Christiangramia flava JLT2011 TaxID=1229726 RepID=A0A1L7IB27_9FLAO|nr:RNA polymerase sigma factor [Christiangramia flava]APU70315.1 RNA polymerase ECF-type sigma factor [Christiangramia flava JLT2011]OSS37559.1 DNA-directed RNA polymerase [Christiangramia flava JLT2011]
MTPTINHINDLVDRCREGDQRAQMQVYDRYYKAMYNTAFRITGHSAEAEDIMQEAFLSAFTKIDSFHGNSTFGAWLKRIVVNESITAYNKSVKLGEVRYNDELKNEADDTGVALAEDEKASKKVRKILKAINLLKSNYRLGLTLHLIEGYDYEEICEIMDISYANCRTMISRAKQSLRKKLEKDGK